MKAAGKQAGHTAAVVFLRVLRVIFVVSGIGLAALGLIMIAADARTSGGGLSASWRCEQRSERLECYTTGGHYGGPGGVVNLVGWLGLPIGGVVLVGAAIALGQFDRPRQPSAPGPQYSGAPGPGQQPPQPTPGGRPPGSW